MVGEAAFEVDRGRAFAWSVSIVGGLVVVVGESGMMSGQELVEREAVHRVECTSDRSWSYLSGSMPLVYHQIRNRRRGVRMSVTAAVVYSKVVSSHGRPSHY